MPEQMSTASPVAEPSPAEPRAVSFETHPDRYAHWKLSIEGAVATLAMDVREDGGLVPGYPLKLNSYDLGVDIELYDAVQRLRFEHPEVRAVVITSLKPGIFCAGANIRMLGQSTHRHKVNFCKFTNETRNGIEDASAHSGQRYLCLIGGTASGGGYELALATDYILMADDGNTAVSLPEVPLLAVLPGTGGLTRLVDKRHVRRDRADFFCTVAEGIKGQRAVEWNLVDEVAPRSKLEATASQRAAELAARSDRPPQATGITLEPLAREHSEDALRYRHLGAEIDHVNRCVRIRVDGPGDDPPADAAAAHAQGDAFWPLALARELDDLILHLRHNEPEIGTWVFTTRGEGARVAAYDQFLAENRDDWLMREVTLYMKRTLKRIDVTSRSLLALIEPGSCYTGTLLELALAADRSFMLEGTFEDSELPAPTVRMTAMNFGPLPMCNGLSRLASRMLGEPERVDALRERVGEDLDAAAAEAAGLVTFIPDDIDWEDEVRIAIEERASFSPDSLTGMEANLRFAGPETVESKIFGRLSAWQNWIFQRPNAVGAEGALKLYGSGHKADYDKSRV